MKVLCTNPDITYADKHVLPRFTVGAIVTAVQALYKTLTGKQFDVQYFGKPYASIYECAKKRFSPESDFYMIGDSLEADIKGGNDNGCASVLVLTGKGSRQDLQSVGPEF